MAIVLYEMRVIIFAGEAYVDIRFVRGVHRRKPRQIIETAGTSELYRRFKGLSTWSPERILVTGTASIVVLTLFEHKATSLSNSSECSGRITDTAGGRPRCRKSEEERD